jgi:hypothetical protein
MAAAALHRSAQGIMGSSTASCEAGAMKRVAGLSRRYWHVLIPAFSQREKEHVLTAVRDTGPARAASLLDVAHDGGVS